MNHPILLEKPHKTALEFAERWVLIVTSGKRDFTQQNKSPPPGAMFDAMWRWPCCSAPSARSLRVYLDRLPKTVSQVSRCWTNSFNSVTIRGFRRRRLMNTYCSSGCLAVCILWSRLFQCRFRLLPHKKTVHYFYIHCSFCSECDFLGNDVKMNLWIRKIDSLEFWENISRTKMY